MRARPSPSESGNRSAGRKRVVVNYREHGQQDSGCDSNDKATLKLPQPLDNKSYRSATRMATQCMIEANKAKKQPKGLNGGLLPVATEPIQNSACIGNLHAENNTLPDDTDKSSMLPLPDDMPKSSPVGTDTTITNQSNVVPPDATNSQSTLPDKTKTQDDNAAIEPADEKPSRGVFKTMTITIRRSKDPRTFKCSVCGTRAPTLHELNAHFIQNHHNIN